MIKTENDIKNLCFSLQQPKEKESTGRRIASFFNSLTPNSSKSARKAGFTGLVNNNATESSRSDLGSTELPPLDNKTRLTLSNGGSRSTTPSYADLRASSRNVDRDRLNSHKSSKSASHDEENQTLLHTEVVIENVGAGASTSRSQSDRVIYPVRTKTSEQLR